MPRTKPQTEPRPGNGATAKPPAESGKQPDEVLTLAEVAAYLRAREPDVLRLVQEQGLPGRRVGDGWRFLKPAVERWLSTPAAPERGRFWEAHFGALEGDPYLADIVREAYRQRGRPEDGEP
jgi:excisionase family DNA binding protein